MPQNEATFNMVNTFSAMIATADILFFLFTFLFILFVGMYAGRKESNSKDYFLGGKTLPWWGIAGSLFGTNISANHLVGMLGIGFSVGFAQSHYEFGSIPAIVLLAFVFLPVFRRKKFYTLSQFLVSKYGKSAGQLYSFISLVLILIQLTGALYIGARSFLPFCQLAGINFNYTELVLIISFTSTVYTWFGGLKSVVYTDVIQTFLILASGILLAYLAITRPEVGGFFELLQTEKLRSAGENKMNLYLSSDHPVLPWSGALSGLFLLHIFYWNTNQYVVQRTLGGKSLREARLGIVVGGLLKLTVPFFSVLTGIAAFQIWSNLGEAKSIDPDETFSKLVVLIVPLGYGIVGIILAGLLGAIFSSIDSMLHSAATLFTIDFYKPLVQKLNQSIDEEKELKVGRFFLICFSMFVTLIALVFIDPKSKGNFFIELSAQSSHFTPGLLVVFLFGILNFPAKPFTICLNILITPIFSFGIIFLYSQFAPDVIQSTFGKNLNFLHRVFLTFTFSILFLGISSFLQYRNRIPNFFPILKKILHRIFSPSKTFVVWSVVILFFSISILIRMYFQSLQTFNAYLSGSFIILFGFIFSLSKRNKNRSMISHFRKRDEWLFGILLGVTYFFYLWF